MLEPMDGEDDAQFAERVAAESDPVEPDSDGYTDDNGYRFHRGDMVYFDVDYGIENDLHLDEEQARVTSAEASGGWTQTDNAAVAENAGPRDSSPTPSPRRHSFNHYPLLEDNLPLQPHKGLSRLHPGVGTTPPERHWPRSQGVEAQSALSGKRETSSSGCQEDRNQREVAHRLREDSEGYFDDDDEDFEGALVKAVTATGTQARAGQRDRGEGALIRRSSTSGSVSNHLGVKLLPVSSLPDVYRSMWRFGVFNAVQSVTYNSIYLTDRNVVVCAPTSSGKTVLFELAILRLFSTQASSSVKVVYMAPTKSLCNERAVDWKEKFERLGFGWTVLELTGDTTNGPGIWKDIKSSRLIVTTPEKWDSVTRKWNEHDKVLAQLRLLCVDECHSVGMDVRGATLEVVVSRMKTLGTSTRFVAVSATVPNIEDVAEWLCESNGQPAKVYKFGDEFRPCQLQRLVIGYPPKGNDFQLQSSLNFKLFELIKQHSSRKPVLIFCNTRKGCVQAAEALAKEYQEAVQTSSRRNDLLWPKPNRPTLKTLDKKLRELCELGIAYHHAGLEPADRKTVESGFTDGQISIVCATSTLSVGVNLPARMVIIKGTTQFKDGRFEEYSDLDILQMLGRAGRPQFDTTGVACILTDKEHQGHYDALVKAQKKLESCLHESLPEHINSEITLRTITDVQTALQWLRSTFLFVRIRKDPATYALSTGGAASADAQLEELCLKAVKDLASEGIVEEGDNFISPTAFGDMMAKFYLSQSTFVALKKLPMKASMRVILETVSSASEFSSIRFRTGEKAPLIKANKNLKYPVAKLVTSADKVMILVQLILECVPSSDLKTENLNPLADVPLIWTQLIRIIKCLVDLCLERRDGGVRTVIELLRSVHSKAWDNSAFVLRQIDGVGVKAFSEKGIATFEDLRNADPGRLELLVNRLPPFGRKLINYARAVPKFSISLDVESEEALPIGVKLLVGVQIGVEPSLAPIVTRKGRLVYHALVLVTTSDGEYIEFRRIRLDRLVGERHSFSLAVVLVKPSQRLVASISCDCIAGSEVKTTLRPSTGAEAYPVPAVGHQASSALETTKTKTVQSDLMPLRLTAMSNNGGASSSTQRKDSLQEETKTKPPRKRADGKYDCNHRCADKTACRHLCCRQGTDKPPRASKSNASTKSTKSDSRAEVPVGRSSSTSKQASTSSSKSLKRKKTQHSTDDDGDDTKSDALRLPPPKSKKTKKSRPKPIVKPSDTDEEDQLQSDSSLDLPLASQAVAASRKRSRVTFEHAFSSDSDTTEPIERTKKRIPQQRRRPASASAPAPSLASAPNPSPPVVEKEPLFLPSASPVSHEEHLTEEQEQETKTLEVSQSPEEAEQAIIEPSTVSDDDFEDWLVNNVKTMC